MMVDGDVVDGIDEDVIIIMAGTNKNQKNTNVYVKTLLMV